MNRVVEFVGVYHADGGLRGEAKYIISKFLGKAHCALCDITHSPVRRKPAWDAMVSTLGVPFTLVHLNEMRPDVAAAVAGVGSPVVLARMGDGALAVALGPAELDGIDGSVASFSTAIDEAIRRHEWVLGG